MHRFTLKFSSQHVEKAYKKDFIATHILSFRIVIWIMLVALIVWTVIEIAFTTPIFEYILLKAIAISLIIILTAYAMTKHYEKNFVEITIIALYIVVLFKFLTEIWFLREGGMASAMVPLITFVLFNVDWV
jgi:hypothetical protein